MTHHIDLAFFWLQICLDALDTGAIPELTGSTRNPKSALTDLQVRQVLRRLPSFLWLTPTWHLLYSNLQHGISLQTLYREVLSPLVDPRKEHLKRNLNSKAPPPIPVLRTNISCMEPFCVLFHTVRPPFFLSRFKPTYSRFEAAPMYSIQLHSAILEYGDIDIGREWVRNRGTIKSSVCQARHNMLDVHMCVSQCGAICRA